MGATKSTCRKHQAGSLIPSHTLISYVLQGSKVQKWLTCSRSRLNSCGPSSSWQRHWVLSPDRLRANTRIGCFVSLSVEIDNESRKDENTINNTHNTYTCILYMSTYVHTYTQATYACVYMYESIPMQFVHLLLYLQCI